MEERVVNESTGEVLNVIDASQVGKITNTGTEPMQVVMVIGANQQVGYKTKTVGEQTKRRMKWHYSMLNIDDLYEYISKIGLSDNELAFLTYAMVFIDYGCILCDRETGQYIHTAQLPKLLHWSKSKVVDVLNSLEKRDMLVRFEDGRRKCVMMNPELLYRGHSNKFDDIVKRYKSVKEKKTPDKPRPDNK